MKFLYGLLITMMLVVAAAPLLLMPGHLAPVTVPMPTVIHWRGVVYPVRSVHGEFGPNEDLLGLTFCNAKIVIVDVEQRPDAQRDTFLHEAMHVITSCDSHKTDVHQAIYELSPRLVEFLQSNPDAARYLAQ